jgi:DNA polymerase V
MRAQGSAASHLITFAHGSRYRPNPPVGSRSARLSPPTNDPCVIVGVAGKMMESMFRPGGVYTKCGVLLEDLTPEGHGQADLFARPIPKRQT